MKTGQKELKDAGHPLGTVLVVDDKQENIRLLFEALQAVGYRTLAAASGEGAIRQATLARPDLILLDVMMPGMDGFAACRELKAIPETRAIPVIFMTALSDTVDKLRGFAAGGVDYLTKPLQHEEVLARINAHLGRHGLWRDIETYSRMILNMGAAECFEDAWSELATLLANNELTGLTFYEVDASRSFLLLRCSSGFPDGNPSQWNDEKEADHSVVSLEDPVIGTAFKENRQLREPKDQKLMGNRVDGSDLQGRYVRIATPVCCRDYCYGVLLACLKQPKAEELEEHCHWQRILAQGLGNILFQTHSLGAIRKLRDQLQSENEGLRAEIAVHGDSSGAIGNSRAYKRILAQVDLVAPTEAAVLILGESGTGKEVLAQYLHRRSRRADAPLIRVNCAAIPAELFESEFFGHTKGAFTGAVKDRIGRFELAHGGTLFLDEVGEIPLALQGKLLRVLQEGTFERIGDEKTRETDVRIIAATNRNLQEAVQQGRFREDLFYRLSVFPVTVPPLRDRQQDIPELARYFFANVARKMGLAVPDLPDEMFAPWLDYAWPGNIRELQNEVERLMILTGGVVQQITVPAGVQAEPSSTVPLNDRIIAESEWLELQRKNMLRALRQSDGRVDGPGGAAEQLGLRPTTLRSRMQAHGIRKQDIFS